MMGEMGYECREECWGNALEMCMFWVKWVDNFIYFVNYVMKFKSFLVEWIINTVIIGDMG